MPERLTRDEARRIAVRAQLLDAERPGTLEETVEALTLLQIDPTSAVAPSADLMAWSRLGDAYAPSDLRFALEESRTLAEFAGAVRFMPDLGLHLAEAPLRPSSEGARRWLEANASFHADVLARLDADGPLAAPEIEDTAVTPWESSGWTDDKNVTKLLEILWRRGEVAVSGRRGRSRLWDLAARVYPADLDVPAIEEAARVRAAMRLAALGLARGRSTGLPGDPVDVGPVGLEAVVDGVDGTWRLDPVQLEVERSGGFAPRTALLTPFDRLVYDRARALELFDYEYVLEMYKPAAKRRWGYFALPILHGDRLVGKLDAKADRKAGVLRVFAVHEDVPFTPEVADAVDDEIQALARWLGLETEGG